jgi:hypothetical protein
MIHEFNVLDFKPAIQSLHYDLELCDDSVLNGTNQYLTISMGGYFIREGRHCLVFTCQARKESSLDLRSSGISTGEENELDLGLSELSDGLQQQEFYIDTDTDFNRYDNWTLTINVSRGGKRGTWKYTKASAIDS